MAPGTHLFAAKVLNAQGSGTESQVVCGIDWATSTRTDSDPSNDITVANMSLGGIGPAIKPCATETDPEHLAICRATAAGITFVVAAGNSGYDYDFAPQPDVPAAYPEVLTVTAVSDSDGLSGGTGGAPSCRTGELDDRYASFSNFAATAAGQAHTIAAPGVCIRSTWKNGGYNTISGTSMATPHMAGDVALCFGEGGAPGPCTGLTPDQVIAKMRGDAAAEPSSYGFTGDPLHPVSGRYYGFLAYAGAAAPTQPPAPVAVAPATVTIPSGSLVSGTVGSLAADDTDLLKVSSTTSGTPTTSWYGTFTSVPSSLSALKVTYKGRASVKCSQTLAILRNDGAWVALDTRSINTTEVLIADRTPPGAASDYVNASGEVRARLVCTRTSGTFKHLGNLLRLTYTPSA
jgi:subtilisin family serine protease